MEIYSVAEAAQELGATSRRVRYWCAQGHLKGARQISGVWVIPARAVKQFAPPPTGRPKKQAEAQ